MKTRGSEALGAYLDRLGHGGASSLAFRLGVDQSTVSRWRSGLQPPGMQYRAALCNATAGQVIAADWSEAIENGKKRGKR